MLKPFRIIVDEHCKSRRVSKPKLMSGNRSSRFTRLRTEIVREAYRIGYTKSEIAHHLKMARSSIHYHIERIEMSGEPNIESLAYNHRLHQMEADRNVNELIKLQVDLTECLTCFASLPVEFIKDRRCKWCSKSKEASTV